MATARDDMSFTEIAHDIQTGCREAFDVMGKMIAEGTSYLKEITRSYYNVAGQYTFPVEKEIFEDENGSAPKSLSCFSAGATVGLCIPIALTCLSSVTAIPLIGNSIQSLPKGFIRTANFALLDLEINEQLFYQKFAGIDPAHDERHWGRRYFYGAPGYLIGAGLGLLALCGIGLFRGFKHSSISLIKTPRWIISNSWNYTGDNWKSFEDSRNPWEQVFFGFTGTLVGGLLGGLIGIGIVILRLIGNSLIYIGIPVFNWIITITGQIFSLAVVGAVRCAWSFGIANLISFWNSFSWLAGNGWNFTGENWISYQDTRSRLEKMMGFFASLAGGVLGGIVGISALALRFAGNSLIYIGKLMAPAVNWMITQTGKIFSLAVDGIYHNGASFLHLFSWLINFSYQWNLTNASIPAFTDNRTRAQKQAGFIGSIAALIALPIAQCIGTVRCAWSFVKANLISFWNSFSWLAGNGWNFTGENWISYQDTRSPLKKMMGFFASLAGGVLGGIVGIGALALRLATMIFISLTELTILGIGFSLNCLEQGVDFIAYFAMANLISFWNSFSWLASNAWNFRGNNWEAYRDMRPRVAQVMGCIGSLIGGVLGVVVGIGALALRFVDNSLIYIGNLLAPPFNWIITKTGQIFSLAMDGIYHNGASFLHSFSWLINFSYQWNLTNASIPAFTDNRTRAQKQAGFIGSIAGLIALPIAVCIGAVRCVWSFVKANLISFWNSFSWLASNGWNFTGQNWIRYQDMRSPLEKTMGFFASLAGGVLGGIVGIGALASRLIGNSLIFISKQVVSAFNWIKRSVTWVANLAWANISYFGNNNWASFTNLLGAFINVAVFRYWYNGIDNDPRSSTEKATGFLGYLSAIIIGAPVVALRITIELGLMAMVVASAPVVAVGKCIGKIWRSVCSCVPTFAERFAFDNPNDVCIKRLKNLVSSLKFNGHLPYETKIMQQGDGKKSFSLSLFKCIKLNTKTVDEKLIQFALVSYQKKNNDKEAAQLEFDRMVAEYKNQYTVGYLDIAENIQAKHGMIDEIADFIKNYVFSDSTYGEELKTQVPPKKVEQSTFNLMSNFFHGASRKRESVHAERAEPPEEKIRLTAT